MPVLSHYYQPVCLNGPENTMLVNVVFSDAEPVGDIYSDRVRQHWHIATGCTVTSLCHGYVTILRDQQDGFDYEFMH